MKKTSLFFGIILQAAFCMAQGGSTVQPAQIFQSHMVLQQEMPIKIWGTAPAGMQVTVQLDKEKKKTAAGETGNWLVQFAARKASLQSIQLKINDLVLEDILVGEVWLCSGQSNMVRNLQTVQPDVLPQASLPNLRILNYNHDGVPLVSKKGYTEKELLRCNTKDFFQGQWQPSNEQTAAAFSAVAWYFGRELLKDKKIPVGIIKVAVGGSIINNWISPEVLKADPFTAALFKGDWLNNPAVDRSQKQRAGEAMQHVLKPGEPWLTGKMPYHWLGEPGFLFEAGIAPLKGLSFRGVVWYQGESDAVTETAAQQYRQLFPMMVQNWRRHFNREELPFLFVQLPRFKKETWPEFRQIQAEAARQIPRTWMAVTIDLGLKDNVHPVDKEPVGKRLYLLANQYIYGKDRKNIFPEPGPVKMEEGKIRIVFKPGLGNLLSVEGEIPGFEIETADGTFIPASAVMSAPNTIVITTNKDRINAVRYGWQPYPEPALRLFNESGLPAGPFLHKL